MSIICAGHKNFSKDKMDQTKPKQMLFVDVAAEYIRLYTFLNWLDCHSVACKFFDKLFQI